MYVIVDDTWTVSQIQMVVCVIVTKKSADLPSGGGGDDAFPAQPVQRLAEDHTEEPERQKWQSSRHGVLCTS